MPSRSRSALVPLAILLAASAAACQVPGSNSNNIAVAQTLVEMSDAITPARQESADLQAQIDSLREALAKQDTLVRNLAALAGVPVPP